MEKPDLFLVSKFKTQFTQTFGLETDFIGFWGTMCVIEPIKDIFAPNRIWGLLKIFKQKEQLRK